MAAHQVAHTDLPCGPDREPLKLLPGEASQPSQNENGGTPDVSVHADRRSMRSWPLLLLALPASVAVWSGWVGIGQLTGFGQVRPLPGIWNSLHIDSAITLPVGVEAYAAYALHAWLATSSPLTGRTRRFAKWSAIGSLLLGMAGQVAYHLLTQAGATRAPWAVTTAVACLPVLILGMAAGLTHLIHADASATSRWDPPGRVKSADQLQDRASLISPARLAEAQAAATQLIDAGQRVSRRRLRAAGLHGSNAVLNDLARILTDQTHSQESGEPPPSGASYALPEVSCPVAGPGTNSRPSAPVSLNDEGFRVLGHRTGRSRKTHIARRGSVATRLHSRSSSDAAVPAATAPDRLRSGGATSGDTRSAAFAGRTRRTQQAPHPSPRQPRRHQPAAAPRPHAAQSGPPGGPGRGATQPTSSTRPGTAWV